MSLPCTQSISIHAPREGGDGPVQCGAEYPLYFNPRPLRGGRPFSLPDKNTRLRFQSTPPARGATRLQCFLRLFAGISIHAPREGGDIKLSTRSTPSSVISIHAPRKGGDLLTPPFPIDPQHFNPRPPRGGRHPVPGGGDGTDNFNPRPPQGGRRRPSAWPTPRADFNPRPPRGGRPDVPPISCAYVDFNPRPPRGGRQQRCTVLPADL